MHRADGLSCVRGMLTKPTEQCCEWPQERDALEIRPAVRSAACIASNASQEAATDAWPDITWPDMGSFYRTRWPRGREFTVSYPNSSRILPHCHLRMQGWPFGKRFIAQISISRSLPLPFERDGDNFTHFYANWLGHHWAASSYQASRPRYGRLHS